MQLVLAVMISNTNIYFSCFADATNTPVLIFENKGFLVRFEVI